MAVMMVARRWRIPAEVVAEMPVDGDFGLRAHVAFLRIETEEKDRAARIAAARAGR